MEFDLQLFNLIHRFAGKSDLLDLSGIFLAKYLGYFLIIIFIAMLLFNRDSRRRVYNFLFAIFSFLLSYGLIKSALNFAFYRDRPFVALNFDPLLVNFNTTASFPSGHAVFFFTLASVVYLLVSKRTGRWFYGLAFLIALGRVFVGVHYPLDVVAGAAIGFVIPFLTSVLFKKFKPVKLAVSVQ